MYPRATWRRPGRTSSFQTPALPPGARHPLAPAVLRAPRRSPRSPADRSSGGLRASPTATVFGTVTPTVTASAPEVPKGRLAGLRRRYEPRLATLRRSDTAEAAGRAGALVADHVRALSATVIF